MKVIADMQIPLLHGALEPYANVIYMDGASITAEHVKDADALLVRTRTNCNEALLKGSKVRFIGTATIGMDHIDLDWCAQNGIRATNAPGCNANAVANYMVAVLLEIAVKHGIPLENRTLGIVGVGAVGSLVQLQAKALGLSVLLCDPPRAEREGRVGFCSIQKIQKEADFITFHTPLIKKGTNPTWRMVNGSFLSKLAPHVWVINASRGSVVDNTSLRIALRSNSIAGAVLDVWEGEPEIDGDLVPLIELATPHIAGYSVEGKANATTQVVQKLGETFDIPPLKIWKVSDEAMGIPQKPIILSNLGRTDEEILLDIVRQCYAIKDDDADLRSDLTRFESLRNSYAFRREFKAFTLQFADDLVKSQVSPSLLRKIQSLGFRF